MLVWFFLLETSKRNKVSEQSIYAWRKYSGGLEPADVKCLKAPELENGKLKKLRAGRDLEIDIMREVNREKGDKPSGTR